MTRPVFIVGKPRSGTTFLWSVLVGFDSYVEPFVRSDFVQEGPRFLPDGKWKTSETGCFVNDYNNGLIAIQNAMVMCQKPVLVEKSPSHTKLIHKIATDLPAARFLYMSRPIEDRYESFNRHWPTEREHFYRSDRGWEPPGGTIDKLTREGRLITIEFSKMKEPETLERVVDFALEPSVEEFNAALAFAESRPVGLPWAQEQKA